MKKLCIRNWAMASALAAALAPAAHAADSGPSESTREAQLAAQIAISWKSNVAELGKLLAQRLAVSFVDSSGMGSVALVELEQPETATLGQAIRTVNDQLAGRGLQLQLSGLQLELTNTRSSGLVAPVTVGSASALPSTSGMASATPPQSWQITPADGTLRTALQAWAERAGWQLHWEAGVDVPVTVSATFTGDFREAVKGLFSALSASEVALNALLYTGNNVLRVTESGRRAQ
ncbi:toxin co-regulated pilus biosynthesis Q family protein [Delftia sp. PS-11]|uniref:toxin co-regulated pilus biosynthesis Q family protein n=1 Tax=Delftia sp. PS-11 TaxID=2767222 RepID=UPI0024537D33|nr:toxin co-regulated pilus biosynthesis Q family protein [Delftia sp. PS-11]KAJ8744155.1 toxin co-regulated pilus biosynthesis Q family protein [Delftia sp. PS-11]